MTSGCGDPKEGWALVRWILDSGHTQLPYQAPGDEGRGVGGGPWSTFYHYKVKVTGSKPLKEPESVALMPALALALGAGLQGARPALGLPGDSSGACEDFYSTY